MIVGEKVNFRQRGVGHAHGHAHRVYFLRLYSSLLNKPTVPEAPTPVPREGWAQESVAIKERARGGGAFVLCRADED